MSSYSENEAVGVDHLTAIMPKRPFRSTHHAISDEIVAGFSTPF